MRTMLKVGMLVVGLLLGLACSLLWAVNAGAA